MRFEMSFHASHNMDLLNSHMLVIWRKHAPCAVANRITLHDLHVFNEGGSEYNSGLCSHLTGSRWVSSLCFNPRLKKLSRAMPKRCQGQATLARPCGTALLKTLRRQKSYRICEKDNDAAKGMHYATLAMPCGSSFKITLKNKDAKLSQKLQGWHKKLHENKDNEQALISFQRFVGQAEPHEIGWSQT